jgi:divalent metal cation (Fe/Co/Zn/Cd) transporter
MPIPIVERSEREIAGIIKRKVLATKDVKGCHGLSVRLTGKRVYVEMHVLLNSNLTFENTHRITMEIENEVRRLISQARVTIHTEPAGKSQESIWRLVKMTAEEVPGSRGSHNIHIQNINDELYVDFHLEVSANMTVKQAHVVSDEVEKRLKEANPDIKHVTIHIESASDRISGELIGIEHDLEPYIGEVAKGFPEIKQVHGIRITRAGDGVHVVFQCHFDPDISMNKVHDISNKLESVIRSAYPTITRIDVHEEPA